MAKKFQSTHPHGVRHDAFRRWSNIRRFQSTHPHGVRRKARPSHARRDPCFNPRTHTGCDAICRSAAAYRKSFNPRTHTGCDSGVCSYSRNAVMFQSTHPHGVRLSGTDTCSRFAGPSFNPRTHTGCDNAPAWYTDGIELFQSTHPHGVRQRHSFALSNVLCFNPRTHTGCDVVNYYATMALSGFNPRTHTGCDLLACLLACLRFNPRTHTGCDVL